MTDFFNSLNCAECDFFNTDDPDPNNHECICEAARQGQAAHLVKDVYLPRVRSGEETLGDLVWKLATMATGDNALADKIKSMIGNQEAPVYAVEYSRSQGAYHVTSDFVDMAKSNLRSWSSQPNSNDYQPVAFCPDRKSTTKVYNALVNSSGDVNALIDALRMRGK